MEQDGVNGPEEEKIVQEPAVPSEPTPRMLAWARNSSLYRLNRRMMTERELHDALRRKAMTKFEGMTAELAAKLADSGVAFCREQGFLDDRHYAEVKTASASRSGHSRRRIARDLGKKGVARPLVEEALDEVDDLRSALNFARKRAFGPYRRVELDERRVMKEFSAFARNGYSAGMAQKIVRMSETELAEIEESFGPSGFFS